MNYSPIIRNNDDYFDDLEDTDQIVWAEAMMTVPDLQPTGDWRKDLRSYMANRSPQTGKKLRPRGKKVSGMGFALTMPKEVSILELLNVDPRISAAVLQSVQLCLLLLELLAAPLKQKPDGSRRTKLVAFGALQRLTDDREAMPHRHVHVGVLSLAWNDDERFNRVTSANLKLVSHAGDLLQALFQHQLAWELRQLGYGIGKEKQSFTITGFSRSVVNRFCAGPRTRKGKECDLRAGGTFEKRQSYWRGILSPAERSILELLGKRTPSATAAIPFTDHLKAAADRALKKDFFRPVGDIAVQALRDTFGLLPPDVGLVARWIAGEALDGLEARKFEVDGQWCWGSPAGLREELAFLDLVRALPLADKGWLSDRQVGTWWEKQLAANRHRVAILRADLSEVELAQLKVDLGFSVQLVRDPDKEWLRRSAGVWTDSLKNNRRIIFVSAVDAPRQSLWLKQLPRNAGVPVLWEHMPQRLTNLQVHDWNISFGVGKAVEVFAAKHSHEKSSYLLTRSTELPAMNLEVRRLRAANPKRERKGVKRLVLVPADEEIRPGLLIQFETNAGGFRATELMTVLELGEDQMEVERPGGTHAFVSYDLWEKYRVYQAEQVELERGDRIRLTRNSGDDAVQSGLRRDREFIVESVLSDGTVYLSGGRVLPPEAGHWKYGFCLTFVDKPLKTGLIVCEAEDLPRLQMYGWLRPELQIVECAPDAAVAEQALTLAMSEVGKKRYVTDTDEVSVNLATAFDQEPEGEFEPTDQPISSQKPPPDTVKKPLVTEMEF